MTCCICCGLYFSVLKKAGLSNEKSKTPKPVLEKLLFGANCN